MMSALHKSCNKTTNKKLFSKSVNSEGAAQSQGADLYDITKGYFILMRLQVCKLKLLPKVGGVFKANI